jgi:hypothetical protein
MKRFNCKDNLEYHNQYNILKISYFFQYKYSDLTIKRFNFKDNFEYQNQYNILNDIMTLTDSGVAR